MIEARYLHAVSVVQADDYLQWCQVASGASGGQGQRIIPSSLLQDMIKIDLGLYVFYACSMYIVHI